MTTVTQMLCFTQTEVGNFAHVVHYHLEPIFPRRKKKECQCQQDKKKLAIISQKYNKRI